MNTTEVDDKSIEIFDPSIAVFDPFLLQAVAQDGCSPARCPQNVQVSEHWKVEILSQCL